jgi:hypothetical protein
LVTQINNTATLRLPFFCSMVGEFAEGFSAGDTDTDWDAGTAINLCTDPSP